MWIVISLGKQVHPDAGARLWGGITHDRFIAAGDPRPPEVFGR
jgi:hypothetical protein